MVRKGSTKNSVVKASAGVTSAQPSLRSPNPAATDRALSLCLHHLSPQVLHLLVEIGARGRIGLRTGEEVLLLVEAQNLLLVCGERRLGVRRHAPIARGGGKARLP